MENALPPRGGIEIFFINVNAYVLVYIWKSSLPIGVLSFEINYFLLPVLDKIQTKTAGWTGFKSNYYIVVESRTPTIWRSWFAIRSQILLSMHDSVFYRNVSLTAEGLHPASCYFARVYIQVIVRGWTSFPIINSRSRRRVHIPSWALPGLV